MGSKKILVTPLNWGLGHATRDIPIIRALIDQGHEVHFGSDGLALALLKAEFPALPSVTLPGYDIHYKGKNLVGSLFKQFPSMLRAVMGEFRTVKRYVRLHDIDVIISDNRFGCISPKTQNIFISHQLRILMQPAILSALVSRINRFFINRFDTCWIPDHPGKESYSGVMSSTHGIKNPFHIGPISRFQPLERPMLYDFIAVLSGPEPSRTQLEAMIISQCAQLPYKILMVRGLPGNVTDKLLLPSHITSVNFMTSSQLNEAICQAKYVLSRTGYTTLLDLAVLQKSGILIPTPGQPEQEYLATVMEKNGRFIIGHQSHLDLASLIQTLLSKTPANTSPPVVDRLSKALATIGL